MSRKTVILEPMIKAAISWAEIVRLIVAYILIED
jgi:hypothetical protein